MYAVGIGNRPRSSVLRSATAVAVALVACAALLFADGGVDPHRARLFRWPPSAQLPSVEHVLVALVALALLTVTPGLWRGTRTAAWLAVGGLALLVVADLHRGHLIAFYVVLPVAAALVAGLARGAFTLGCRNRPEPVVLGVAGLAWAGAAIALLLAPVAYHPSHDPISQAIAVSAGRVDASSDWRAAIELLIVAAAAVSVLALRTTLRADGGGSGHSEHDRQTAKAIIDRYGEDSLTPFMLRPDKALSFAAGGVLSFRVIGETAIISADPVAPPGQTAEVLRRFLDVAHERGWQVALWGASAEHLASYRELGLRSICVGEEAFVAPERFNLEGRAVRKLRQSVNRIERRGWEISAVQGRDLDEALESEIDRVEAEWRSEQESLLGFAMSMGSYEAEIAPDDLYVLARAPEGDLRGVMRFPAHCGHLSLDSMRRVGETPNGLNEALVCRALGWAREHEIPEVSLNYAGLAHLVRAEQQGGRLLGRLLVRVLRHRFQMERLVCFNEKFSPEWRPRYLVFESRVAFPRSIVRVLQAEGYLPGGARSHGRRLGRVRPRLLPGSAPAKRAG